MTDLPLAGRRILVTRSREQASELAEHLTAAGATSILIPTIEIAPPSSYCALDAALASIRAYDIVLFTSANAIRAFDQRARSQRIVPSPRSVAVVGPATARAVEAIGLHVDLIPPTFTAQSLAEALIPQAAGRQILLVRAEHAPDVLPSTLERAGATVSIAAAYSNRMPASSIAAIISLLSDASAHPDAITFTSASTATNLLALLEAARFTLPASVVRASIGPITSAALCELGLQPSIEAAEATIASLVAALVHHFNKREDDTVSV